MRYKSKIKNERIAKAKIINRKKMFKPETNIKEIQVEIIKTVCPRSGWIKSKKVTIDNKINDIR